MKLNYDCIRDILIYLEDNLNFGEELEWPVLSMDDLETGLADKGYTRQEIGYSLLKMEEAGLIDGTEESGDGRMIYYFVSQITYDGHEYLGKIRSDNVWKKTKGVLSKIGSASISIVSSVASKVLSDLITNTPIIG